jgi:hypothetical protein
MSYYARLTQITPADVQSMDIGLGKIIAETAATGRFIINEIDWKSAVAPNSSTFTAMLMEGELRIVEPLGTRFLDYLRFAALELGIINHLDARYILDIEFLSQEMTGEETLKYSWPIQFLGIDCRIHEKGSEYTIKYVHAANASMTSVVQSLKETVAVKGVKTIKEYFEKLSTTLEKMEFQYAESGQKAGSIKAPGGVHPSATDPYHDEYHFIVDPRIENWTFTDQGSTDNLSKTWFGFGTGWNIEARKGTTINAQINKVLASTREALNLYSDDYDDKSAYIPMRGASAYTAQDPEAQAVETVRREEDAKTHFSKLIGKIYNFIRVESYTVNKQYDYVRGRYAVKHVYFIWEALQPNMYQYPDELDILNRPSSKDTVLTKLKAYIQEGLLAKSYYHNYTGMNTEILKLDVNLNHAFYLPSFPVIWTDRGTIGQGEMTKHNYSKSISPYATDKAKLDLSVRIGKLQAELKNIRAANSTNLDKVRDLISTKEKALANLTERRDAIGSQTTASTVNGIKNRKDFLSAITNLYVEDIDYSSGLTLNAELSDVYMGLRPVMQPDAVGSLNADKKAEAESIMDKIFNVMLQSKDLLNLEMEIRGDPYWFGPPNIGVAGSQLLQEIELPPAFKTRVDMQMQAIDPNYFSRSFSWGKSIADHANYYKGGNLVYLHMQLPNTDDDEFMQFDVNDSIIGIYQILHVDSMFRDGMFTQKISGVRDLTIPSQFIPRSNSNAQDPNGVMAWENFMKGALTTEDRAVDTLKEKRKQAELEREAARDTNSVDDVSSPYKSVTSVDDDVAEAAFNSNKEREASEIPTVVDPIANANALVAEGHSKESAYKIASAQYKEEVANTLATVNEIDAKNYKGTDGQPIKKYRLYDPQAVAQVLGDGGLTKWKNGDPKGELKNNNPAGLGYDPKSGKSYSYKTPTEAVIATSDYMNFGRGVPQSEGKAPNRYLLPTTAPVKRYDRITGNPIVTGTKNINYSVEQQVQHFKTATVWDKKG